MSTARCYIAVLALLWPICARANAPAADGLPRSSDGFGAQATDRADVDAPGDLAVRLDLDYLRSPLRLSTGGAFTRVVSNELGLRAGLEVGIWHHLEAGVWVPVTFDTYSSAGKGLVPEAAGAATGYDLGAGDIRLFLKVNALKSEHLGLAFLGGAVLASGDKNAFRSDGWGGDLRVIFDVSVRWLGLAFNFGARLHGREAARDSTGAHLLDVGTELTWAAAFSAAVHPKLSLVLELAGTESVTPSVGDSAARTAEALLTLRIKPTPAFHVFAGVGRSLNPSSARADDFRLVAGFAWHPTGERVGRAADRDHDGIPDDRDRCPNEPEDKDGWQDDDGCPNPDNDGDGIPDAQDQCPNEPEDKDGWQDADGCPDVDNDGDGIPDNQDRCPNQPGPTESDGCPARPGAKPVEPAPVAPKPIEALPVVRFAHNSTELDAASLQAIGKLVDFLGYHREVKRVRLEGHTSSDERNGDVLSFERAQEVMRALAQRGVDPGRLQPVGYGPRRPAGKRAEENRRVECIVVDLPGGGCAMKRAIILLLVASVAHAENNVDVPGVDVDLDAIYKTLDQVVVLAAKRPQTLREAPASTSVITAADLEAYGWRNFTEAIASLAGFFTNNPGDLTYFGVRGISGKGDTNGRILVLVDGHQQQELWSHSFYPEQSGLDASMIDHIEVLRGPASALYGSLGFLAIINVVTKRGTEKDWTKLTFEMTNASGFRGVALLGHRFKNDLEFGLSLNAWGGLGESYTYPDLKDDSTCSPDIPSTCKKGVSDRATDADVGVAMYGHLEYKGLSVKLSYQWWDKHIPFAPYRTLFNDHANHYRLDRGYIDIGYTAGVPEKAQFSIRGYFDYSAYLDDLAYSDSGEPQDRYLFHDEAHPWWSGAEAKLLVEREWAQRLRFSFTLGGEFTYFHGDDQSGVTGDPTSQVKLSHDLIFGAAYAQTELGYARKLFLTFGLRGDFANFMLAHDDFSRRYELSPRAAVVLLPYPSGTFKLLYSHGFIHPAWYDVFFNDGISILDNPKLGPERADNYELVYQQEIGEPMLLTTSLFYIHGSDLIDQAVVCVPDSSVTAPSPDCPAGQSARTQRQNLKSFQSLGAEIGLTGKFKRGIRMYANYSYAHATNGDGSRPFNSPEHLFKAGASIPVWRDHLVLGAELNVISQRRLSDDSPDLSAPAALLNAFILWKGLPKGLVASFKVYNLTGITWYEPSTAEDSFPIVRIPHPGPTFALRLSYQY